MILEEGNYYLYRHVRLDNNQPFYIGIGTKKQDRVLYESVYGRAFTKSNRNLHWKNIVNKFDYKVDILIETNDYDFLEEKEKEFIKLYGRTDKNTGTLVNWTDGGKGSDKNKKKKRNSKKVAWNLGKKLSEEHKKKLSFAQKNLPLEKRLKINNSLKGRKFSEKGKENMKIAAQNKENNGKKILNSDTGKIYKSIMECSKDLNIPNTTLYRNIMKQQINNKFKNLTLI